MQRTFNAFDKATIKNSAKAVAHYFAKNITIDKKIEALEAEKKTNLLLIDQYTKPVIDLTGYSPLDLCEKVSRGSQNDWVFKYPDTIIPVEAEKVEEKEEDSHSDTSSPYSEEEREEANQIMDAQISEIPEEETVGEVPVEDEDEEENEEKSTEHDPMDDFNF